MRKPSKSATHACWTICIILSVTRDMGQLGPLKGLYFTPLHDFFKDYLQTIRDYFRGDTNLHLQRALVLTQILLAHKKPNEERHRCAPAQGTTLRQPSFPERTEHRWWHPVASSEAWMCSIGRESSVSCHLLCYSRICTFFEEFLIHNSHRRFMILKNN